VEVKPGYKLTEVGVIPEDWQADTLGRFWSVKDCKHITAKFGANGYPVASIGEVQSSYVDLGNAKHTTASYFFTLIEGGRKPQVGDLIISRNATVGEIAQVAEWHPPFAMGQDVCLLRKKSAKYSTGYLQSVFRSSIVLQQLENLMVGSTFKRVNIAQIRDLAVPMPSPMEQGSIAATLSDVDALLVKLDQLIAKKRDLKQAAIQQLLTGKTRLPGFSEEWVVRRLDELACIRSGGTPSTSESRFWDGDIPWCTPTDITALRGHKYLAETSRTITPLGLKASSAELIPPSSIVMTTRATIGECAINIAPVSTNQGFKNFVPFSKTDVDFLYYLLTTQKQGFISLCGGSTFLEIGKRQLAAYEVWLPSTKDEQTAIASVLGAMDAELAALEARRAKTRLLKQGMMQELLTGRVRLAH
jgi:type I restriction enzyme, S subunit